MVGWLGEVQHRYQRQPVNYRHIFNCTEGRCPLLLCCSRVSCIRLQFWTLLWNCCPKFSSVVQSCPTLWPHELQHTRPPCLSPTPSVYPNPCPLSRWYHPSHPLSSPSPPALNLSQYQGLMKYLLKGRNWSSFARGWEGDDVTGTRWKMREKLLLLDYKTEGYTEASL